MLSQKTGCYNILHVPEESSVCLIVYHTAIKNIQCMQPSKTLLLIQGVYMSICILAQVNLYICKFYLGQRGRIIIIFLLLM